MRSEFLKILCIVALAIGIGGQAKAVSVQPGGPENPVLIFGFNPQPEPPPIFLFTQSEVVNPFDAVAQVSGVQPTPFTPGIDPTPFQLTLTTLGGTLVPPDPIAPVGSVLSLMLTTVAGVDLTVQFTFLLIDGTTETPILPTDIVGFNPQPEPPAGPNDSFGILFDLPRFDGTNTVAVKMQVIQGDTALGLTVVPLPATLPLVLGGLAALGLLRRRTG